MVRRERCEVKGCKGVYSLLPYFPSPPPFSIHCARITRPHFSRTSRDQLVRVTNEVVVRKLAKFSDFHSDLKRCMSCWQGTRSRSLVINKPVTLKYCSANATLVGNTLLIKRPNVLVPIQSADSLALKTNINKLETKQPIWKRTKLWLHMVSHFKLFRRASERSRPLVFFFL